MGLDTNVVYNYNNGDELFTKENAITPLLEFIPKDAIVWECAEKQTLDGNITKLLRRSGIKVITTSIHNGEDFLLTDLPKNIQSGYKSLVFEAVSIAMNVLKKINESGRTIIMATHDYALIMKFPSKTLKCEENTIFEVIQKSV